MRLLEGGPGDAVLEAENVPGTREDVDLEGLLGERLLHLEAELHVIMRLKLTEPDGSVVFCGLRARDWT